MRKTDLYRAYDEGGRLLYVGISFASIGRLTAHRTRSIWFDRVANVTIEAFPCRSDAVEAEKLAIQNESPLFNQIRYQRKQSRPRKPKGYQHNAHMIAYRSEVRRRERFEHLCRLSDDCIEKARVRDLPTSGAIEMDDWRDALSRLSGA